MLLTVEHAVKGTGRFNDNLFVTRRFVRGTELVMVNVTENNNV